jgi:hypothetical protein
MNRDSLRFRDVRFDEDCGLRGLVSGVQEAALLAASEVLVIRAQQADPQLGSPAFW